MWKEKTLLMDEKAMGRAIRRIAHEIIEHNKGLDSTILVGIHTRGVPLAKRLGQELEAIEGRKSRSTIWIFRRTVTMAQKSHCHYRCR